MTVLTSPLNLEELAATASRCAKFEAYFDRGSVGIPITTVELPGGITVGQNKVISFAMATVISLGVYLFLKLHRFGKAIRATAQNADVAMVCGIDVRWVYIMTTGLAAALAAAWRSRCPQAWRTRVTSSAKPYRAMRCA